MTVALSPALPEITPEIFTSASAIVGIRGSGKTNDGVLLAEQAKALRKSKRPMRFSNILKLLLPDHR